MTLADSLPLISLIGLLIVTVLTLVKRTTNGVGAATAARMIGEAWKALYDEKVREADIQRALARARGEQLDKAGISPISEAQAESLSDTAKWIEQRFSVDEIDGLAFAVDIRPDSLEGETAAERARELVLAADRRNRLARLVTNARKERPD